MRGIRGRRDIAHAAVRDGLRDLGWSVEDTADSGRGFPDLVAGKRGETWLIEIKSPGRTESAEQAQKRALWRGGRWIVVRSLADALAQMEPRIGSA